MYYVWYAWTYLILLEFNVLLTVVFNIYVVYIIILTNIQISLSDHNTDSLGSYTCNYPQLQLNVIVWVVVINLHHLGLVSDLCHMSPIRSTAHGLQLARDEQVANCT
jgi:hypothetical protein